jgi:hypothetical protein
MNHKYVIYNTLLFVYFNKVRQLLKKERYDIIKRRNTEETPMLSRVLMDSKLILNKKQVTPCVIHSRINF